MLGLDAQAPHPLLLSANQYDHDISIIDAVERKQIATVPEGSITGHEVIASPDGRTAYVPIYGNTFVGGKGTDGDHMVVIDIPSRKVIGVVKFGHGVRPHCPMYDTHDGNLYVTTELDHTVTIVDPHTLKVVGAIPTGQAESHMLVISHDGKRAYTANVGPGSVSVLDLESRKLVKVIPVSTMVQRISISKDDSMVFTADQAKPRLAVIDTATNTIKTWIPLPAVGYGTAVTKDGRFLLVAMQGPKQVAVVDLHLLKVIRTLPMPSMPSEILAAPGGRMAYVSCGQTRQIAVIDLTRWRVEGSIEAGNFADGLAWAP